MFILTCVSCPSPSPTAGKYHAGRVHDMRMFICQSPVFLYILDTAFFLFLRCVYSLLFDRIFVFNIYHDSFTLFKYFIVYPYRQSYNVLVTSQLVILLRDRELESLQNKRSEIAKTVTIFTFARYS